MEKEVLRLFKSYLGEKSENFSKEGLMRHIISVKVANVITVMNPAQPKLMRQKLLKKQ